LRCSANAGRAWASLYIGGRKSSEVVSVGPYSITRNPLYVFSLIGAAGIGAQTGSIIITAACFAAAMIVFRLTIAKEEAFLAQSFGPAYDSYRARVPMLWPALRLYRDEDRLMIEPRRLYGTLRDSSMLFLAFPVFETIELMQQAGMIPVLLRLW
jgi:hypothetical protein